MFSFCLPSAWKSLYYFLVKGNDRKSVTNMKKSAIYAIVAVIVIIVVIVAAVFALGLIPMGGTPAATPTPSAATGVADASSIIFSSNVTSGGTTTMYKWQGINIHSNATFRVDLEGGYSYILNVANETAFESTDSGATWTTGSFTTDWAAWGATWQDYLDNLAHWNGSDATYSINDATIGNALVFDISVNPTIPPATFNQ